MEFKTSKIKIICLLLGCVVFVCASIFMTIYENNIFNKVWGYLGVIFFGLGGIVIFKRLLTANDEVIVVFSGEGIEDKRMKIGVIPWGDIVAIKKNDSGFLSLQLLNSDMYIKKFPKSKLIRGSISLNRVLKFPNFNIVFTDLTPSIKQALEYIRNYHPDKLA